MSLHKTSKFLFFLMSEILNINLNEIVGNPLEEMGGFLELQRHSSR